MGLKAIFIDMGGTIETFRFTHQYRTENCHVIRDCLATKGISLPINDEQLADMITTNISIYSRISMKTNIELPSAEIWANYIFKDFNLRKEALEDISEELAFLYETRLYIREMRPEVPSVLQKIKTLGLTIGCISNTQSITQVPYSMRSYGIYDYFEHIILSSEYGHRKPDPSIFYYAASLAKLPTGECAYIGDKINRDILGAKRAGYSLAVQIKHQYDNGEIDEG
ncbi:MAG: HAD family hydrolase, partial [Anaerolineaceae bacterium]|nr:HAD family hydrolase [Anaerolineaceae bacterium]